MGYEDLSILLVHLGAILFLPYFPLQSCSILIQVIVAFSHCSEKALPRSEYHPTLPPSSFLPDIATSPGKRMVLDPEKADLEAASHVPQDIDGPLSHPGVSTTKDNEIKFSKGEDSGLSKMEDNGSLNRDETDSDSIHSHSSLGTIQAIPQEILPPQRSKSKSSSVRSCPLSIIPRSKRRGLLARFTIIPEVERPYDYKRSTKWLITLQVALAAAAAPMGSAILLRKSSPTTSFNSLIKRKQLPSHN